MNDELGLWFKESWNQQFFGARLLRDSPISGLGWELWCCMAASEQQQVNFQDQP